MGSFLESVGYSGRRTSSALSVCERGKLAGRRREVLVGRQYVAAPLEDQLLEVLVGRQYVAAPLEDQLLLTLMRIRLGWLQQKPAYIFGVSEACVSLTFKKWISFLYLRLGRLPLWPCWENVDASMAECFRANCPDTLLSWMPQSSAPKFPALLPCSHSFHHSSYKSHTTLKGLISISPNGSISFVSELWSGSIGDLELVIKSRIVPLLDHVPPRKRVMADRGFDIQDLVKPSCS